MSSIDKPGSVVAAVATGTAAVMVFALLPVISGAMADQYELSEIEIGEVATSYFSIYALMALCSGLWIRRVNWVHVKHLGYGAMLTGLALCLYMDSFKVAKAGLFITGLGAGLLFPISLTLVSDTSHVERNYAIKLSVEQLVPAGLLFLLATALFSNESGHQVFVAIVTLVVLCWLASMGLPKGGSNLTTAREVRSGSFFLSLISLIALAVNFAGFAGLWAFMERQGNEHLFDANFIATWLGVGLVASGIGPLGATVFENRYGRLRPLLVASAASAGILILLRGDVTQTDFALTLIFLPLAYYFAITYMLSIVAAADHNGKMSGQMSFALAVGAALGPSLFGWIKAGDGPVVLVMGALILTGATVLAMVQRTLEHHEEESQ